MFDFRFLYRKYVLNRYRVYFQDFFWSEHIKYPKGLGVIPVENERFLEPYILGMSPGCFVDVGANVGGWCVKAKKFYPSVHAFEPNPEIFQKLKRTMKMNKVHNAELYPFALGNDTGLLPQRINHIMEPKPGGDNEMLIVDSVPTRQLDNCNLPRISTIKIDAEGAAYKVIEGGLLQIRKERPMVIVECHTMQELMVPELLTDYSWARIDRIMPDNYPAYDAIINHRQPFLIGVAKPLGSGSNYEVQALILA